MGEVLDLVKDVKPIVNSEVELAHELKIYEKRFLLVPALWRRNATRVNLNWKWYKFHEESKNNIPNKRGIYMFVVSHNMKWIPENAYIMYIGIVGNDSKNRTLKDRYKDYLRDQKSSRRRKKINEMLNLWKDDIYFVCSQVSSATKLDKLEGKLIESLLPPYNEGDIPIGEIKNAIKVLRAN